MSKTDERVRILEREGFNEEAVTNPTKHPLSIFCPETLPFFKAITEGNEELQVLLQNTKDASAERIWVLEHLHTE